MLRRSADAAFPEESRRNLASATIGISAAYLELAKRKGLSLATFDKDLVLAAQQEGIVLVNKP